MPTARLHRRAPLAAGRDAHGIECFLCPIASRTRGRPRGLARATHPSDHNAVRFAARNESVHAHARTKYDAHVRRVRKKQDEMQRAKGKSAVRVQMQASIGPASATSGSAGSGSLSRRLSMRSFSSVFSEKTLIGTALPQNGEKQQDSGLRYSPVHDVAFLVPIPLYFNASHSVPGGCVSEATYITDTSGSCTNVSVILCGSMVLR